MCLPNIYVMNAHLFATNMYLLTEGMEIRKHEAFVELLVPSAARSCSLRLVPDDQAGHLWPSLGPLGFGYFGYSQVPNVR